MSHIVSIVFRGKRVNPHNGHDGRKLKKRDTTERLHLRLSIAVGGGVRGVLDR